MERAKKVKIYSPAIETARYYWIVTTYIPGLNPSAGSMLQMSTLVVCLLDKCLDRSAVYLNIFSNDMDYRKVIYFICSDTCMMVPLNLFLSSLTPPGLQVLSLARLQAP